MPQVLKVEPHLSPAAMSQWLIEAPTPALRRRRLAIKLASKGGQRSVDIGEEVGATKDTVCRWVREYNSKGPAAHAAEGRGGWRHGLMTQKAEAEFIADCREDAVAGRVMTGQQIRRKAAKKLGEMPSQPWVYFLLARHDWRKVAPRPTHAEGSVERREAFKKNSRKSSGNTGKKPPR